MFMDTNQSQVNNQNLNNSNNITVGSSGTDFGNFTPKNENTSEFKASNDLGLSAAVGAGATSGPVGMSRAEERAQSKSGFDGYLPSPKDSSMKTILLYIGIGLTAVLSLVSLFKSFKRK